MMYDRKLSQHTRIARDDQSHPMPGRSTLVQQAYDAADAAVPSTAASATHSAASLPLFDGDVQWEEIGPDEGERMVESIELAPVEAPDEAAEDSAADPGAHKTTAGDADGAPGTAVDPAAAAAAERVPSSAYATSHRKDIQNYRFRAGTRITNTVSTAGGVTDVERGDFGAPNEDSPDKVPKPYRRELLTTVSVDIGTVVGGSKRTRYRSGWVLVFHRGAVTNRRPGLKPYSGDHTGWIQVKQLPGGARAKIAASEDALRPKLRRGKGSGHAADATGDLRGFTFSNPEMLFNPKFKTETAKYYDFRVPGGEEGTGLGKYTHNPRLYGDIVVGTWNPAGSGAGGKRFVGSGGIRAFLPLTAQFKLTTVPALTIPDASNRATSIWQYVQATLKGETIYCWLLQSWTTPAGSGHNF